MTAEAHDESMRFIRVTVERASQLRHEGFDAWLGLVVKGFDGENTEPRRGCRCWTEYPNENIKTNSPTIEIARILELSCLYSSFSSSCLVDSSFDTYIPKVTSSTIRTHLRRTGERHEPRSGGSIMSSVRMCPSHLCWRSA